MILSSHSHTPDPVTAPDRTTSLPEADAGAHPIRRLLLALIVVGAAGLLAELLLLEHTENGFQWMPLVTLALIIALTIVIGLRPSAGTVRAYQVLMVLTVLIGALGVFLHYDGNTEFELEMDPSARGFPLLWSALHGATPALAPGALIQLGLLGLVAMYRHPLLRRGA